MKQLSKLTLLALTIIWIFHCQLQGHGFSANTFVRIYDRSDVHLRKYRSGLEGWRAVKQLYDHSIEHIKTKSYHPQSLRISYQPIKLVGASVANCYFRISLDEQSQHVIECTPSQSFYVVGRKKWLPACQLQLGDQLFCGDVGQGSSVAVTKLEFIKKSCPVYMLEVDQYHTFLVGTKSVLTHNMPLAAGWMFNVAMAFGEGAVAGGSAGSYFGPVTCGASLILGGLVGVGLAYWAGGSKVDYKLEFNADLLDQYLKCNDGGCDQFKADKQITPQHTGSGDKEPEKDRNQGKVVQKITTKEATKTAEELGFKKINERTSNNQPIYKKGSNFISPDADRHNNGYWKMANSVKDLERKATRLGTYNQYLTIRIGS